MRRTILEARQEVSRQEIVAAATRLFAERGTRATSLSQLAEGIGITKAALYYYFDSKQDIIVETVRSHVRDFLADILQPLPDGLSPGEALRARLERKLDRVERDGPLDLRFFYTVMLEELEVPEVKGVYQESSATGRAEAHDLITRGQRSGEFRADLDVPATINVLVATFTGIDILWLNDPENVALRPCYDLAINQFLTALSVPKRRHGR